MHVRRWCRWVRVLHRDLGYFVVGGFLIYSVSGFLLSMRGMGVDMMSREEVVSVSLSPGLSASDLSSAWDGCRGDLPALKGVDSVEGGFKARVGRGQVQYDAVSGEVRGSLRSTRGWVRWVNRMHFNSQGEWRVLGAFFGVSLLLLTLSGTLLLRGKSGFARRGVWFALGGVLCVVVFALL